MKSGNDDDDDNDVTDGDDNDYNYDDNAAPNEILNDKDDEKSCDMYEEFNLSVLKIPLGHANKESDTDEYEEDEDEDNEDDDEDDEDFLTTTFTWNLRNKPKLQISDCDDNDNVNKRDNNNEDDNKFNGLQQKSLNKSKDMLCQQRHIKADTPEKEQKLDKLERSWPWADREKIIYKQSTCHLVPQKPLGLIEQRIQLLAKRNLLEHINKTKNP